MSTMKGGLTWYSEEETGRIGKLVILSQCKTNDSDPLTKSTEVLIVKNVPYYNHFKLTADSKEQ